jgi:regulator of RNase E activity RraB
MMNNPFESIIEEFCTRYNLKPEQVKFEVKLMDVEKDLGLEIAKDYGNRYDGLGNYFEGNYCTSITNKNFDLWVHYPEPEKEVKSLEFIIE